MAEYHFKWAHPASEVYVTGTFDNWGKTEKLHKTGDVFSKTVTIPKTEENVYYKFVVDGNWVTDHTTPIERDGAGNMNNVLRPADLFFASAFSSAAPSSSTAALAGQQPVEHHASSALPGSFPETPGLENFTKPRNLSLGGDEPSTGTSSNEQSFGVAPLPATSGAGNPVKLAAGEQVPEPSSYTGNTLDNNVRLDRESYEQGSGEQSFGVSPIPATGGAGNPVKLAAGEKVPEPSTYTGNTLDNNVRLDRESYERGDGGAPQLPPVLDSQEEREAAGASMFGVPSLGGTSLIPESSLPMGGQTTRDVDAGPYLSSAAPQSTTAQLAGQQPIRTRGVPEVVSESQQQAGFAPEASSSTSAVQLKNSLEDEVKNTIPEAPSTSESGFPGKSEKTSEIYGAAAGGVAAAGAAAAGAAYLARDKVNEATGNTTTSAAPKDPEAMIERETGASPGVVHEKEDLGDEIKAKVPEAPATSESGLLGKSENKNDLYSMAAGGVAAAGAAAAGAAYLARDKFNEATGNTTTGSVQDPEARIQQETGAPSTAVHQKEELADEIHQKVPEASTTSESGLLGKSENKNDMYGIAAGGVAAAGATAASAAYATRDKFNEATGNTSTSGYQDPETRIEQETGAPPAAVYQKEDIAEEIHQKVPEAPATSESGLLGKSENNNSLYGMAAGGVAAAGATAAGAAYATRDKTAQATGRDPAAYLPSSVQDAINNMNTSRGYTQSETSDVPAVVIESQEEAHVSPEAAASSEAVREKSAMEKELLSEIKPTNETGEPAPSQTAALSAVAPIQPTTDHTARPDERDAVTSGGLDTSGSAVAADEPIAQSTSGSGLNAPAATPAQTPATYAAEQASASKIAPPATTGSEEASASKIAPPVQDSRDVSPMSKPIVTSGTASGTIPTRSGEGAPAPIVPGGDSATSKTTTTPALSTPQGTPQKARPQSQYKDTPESTRTANTTASASPAPDADAKKNKRRSFFGKLKDKFKA